MSDPALTNVFAFTDEREDVAQFFEQVIGLRREKPHADSMWFASATGATFTVHDRENEDVESGYVPWFHVSDLAAVFKRARSRGATVGGMRDGYFFVRDPDGSVFGVREWR